MVLKTCRYSKSSKVTVNKKTCYSAVQFLLVQYTQKISITIKHTILHYILIYELFLKSVTVNRVMSQLLISQC
jgi:hypothetical protein